MADISKIELPSGVTYTIKDEEARTISLDVTYTPDTKNLALSVTTPSDATNEEF